MLSPIKGKRKWARMPGTTTEVKQTSVSWGLLSVALWCLMNSVFRGVSPSCNDTSVIHTHQTPNEHKCTLQFSIYS